MSNKFGFDVVDLKFASSSEIQETINNVINNSSYTFNDNSSISSQPISIQSYSSGNQLISGFSENRKEILKLIEILDKPTKQVFVEAIVAELSSSKAKELGLQFSGSSGKAGLTILNSNSLVPI